MVTDLTRPIVGIESRTAQEVFDIMCDRLKAEFGTEEAPRYTTRRLREEVRKAEERGQQYEREAALSTDAEPVKTADQIAALQTWSEQKYGARFSVSACHDLLNVLKEEAPAASSVSFKPLEWVKQPTAEMWRSDTIIGRYQVSSIVSPASWTFDGLPGVDAKGFANNEAEAKAAAQADYEARIRSALSAQVQDVAIPEGWQLIPKEPTREMWAAMANTLYGYKNRHHDKVAGDLFQAMLAAAPAAKQGEAE